MKIELELLKRRITKNPAWTIAIDDGYISYKFTLNASGKYSISSLAKRIQNAVRKGKK